MTYAPPSVSASRESARSALGLRGYGHAHFAAISVEIHRIDRELVRLDVGRNDLRTSSCPGDASRLPAGRRLGRRAAPVPGRRRSPCRSTDTSPRRTPATGSRSAPPVPRRPGETKPLSSRNGPATAHRSSIACNEAGHARNDLFARTIPGAGRFHGGRCHHRFDTRGPPGHAEELSVTGFCHDFHSMRQVPDSVVSA